MSRITVIGCGHVGLVMAAGLAELGHEVIGLDVDSELVKELNAGLTRLHEPGLNALLAGGLESRRLIFTTSYAVAVPLAQVIFLCVDTPQTTAGAANLRSIRRAVREIGAELGSTNPVIVVKSTSPVGTGETVEELIRWALIKRDHAPRVVVNPEFLRQGSAVEDFMHPDRIVVGSRDRRDALAVVALYDGLDCQRLVVTDTRTAELIKYVANSFLATRISFINEVARLSDALGTDIDTIVNGVAADPRIGRAMFTPGIGYGGSCLPKDVAALRYAGESVGVPTPVLAAVEEVNRVAKTSIVRRLRQLFGSLEGKHLGVWGLTFKGGTEDVRESPAMDVVALLLNEGALVHAYDPGAGRDPLIGYQRKATPLDAARDADALLVLTDWPEFAGVPFDDVASVMSGRLVIDGRNVLDREDVERADLVYIGIGRGALSVEAVTL